MKLSHRGVAAKEFTILPGTVSSSEEIWALLTTRVTLNYSKVIVSRSITVIWCILMYTHKKI